MTQLFPLSPLAAAQAFLLSLPAVRFEGLAGLCPAHEPETVRSAGEYTIHLCELSLERYMGEADPAEGRGWWTDEEWWGMVQSAQRALNAPRSGGGEGEERMMSFSPKPRSGLQKPQKWPKAFLP